MLDPQTQSAGQMLMGQQQPQPQPEQVGNVPLEQRMAQVPSGPQSQPPQQQPAPQQPTPQQQAVTARHHAIGRAATFLFGQQHDETGQPIKQRQAMYLKVCSWAQC